jgi:hypothetical protein
VVSLVDGLFFKERIETAVKKVGVSSFCATIEELRTYAPSIVIIDLEHPHAVQVLREYGGKVIAFGPQLSNEFTIAAKSFGASIYPRSVFLSDLDKLLYLRT